MKKLSILLTGLAFSVGFGQQTMQSLYGDLNSPTIFNVTEEIVDDCSQQVLSNALENGGLFGDQRLAVDIIVDANSTITISDVIPTLIGPYTYINIIIHTDAAGLPADDAILEIEGAPITNTNVTGQNFGYDFVEVTLTPESPIVLEGGASGASYWMEIYSDAVGWESTTVDLSGEFGAFNNANTGFTWAIGTSEYVYAIVADCSTMGVSDLNTSSVTVYPNPVKDVLNVSTKNADVKEVSITNLNGQVVTTSKSASVNVSALPAGVYVVKVQDTNGNVTTSKIVKK